MVVANATIRHKTELAKNVVSNPNLWYSNDDQSPLNKIPSVPEVSDIPITLLISLYYVAAIE
jgi:hypothetical protein